VFQLPLLLLAVGMLSGGSPELPPGACLSPAGSPEYYQFPLVTTGRIPGAGRASGLGEVRFPTNPFGVAIGADGSYVYELSVSTKGVRIPGDGQLVAWVTTTEIDRIERVGALDAGGRAVGSVSLNKFLVVITLEASDDPEATTWSGPVVLRGMSRSGKMHTMAGHGPFEEEKCAAYGYE